MSERKYDDAFCIECHAFPHEEGCTVDAMQQRIAALESALAKSEQNLRGFLDGYRGASQEVSNALGDYRKDIDAEMFEQGDYSWARHIAERIAALLQELAEAQRRADLMDRLATDHQKEKHIVQERLAEAQREREGLRAHDIEYTRKWFEEKQWRIRLQEEVTALKLQVADDAKCHQHRVSDIEALRTRLAKCVEAATQASIVLSDLMVSYAPDQTTPHDLQAVRTRITTCGGTLAYAAKARAAIKAALDAQETRE